jgi:hypothetical protein
MPSLLVATSAIPGASRPAEAPTAPLAALRRADATDCLDALRRRSEARPKDANGLAFSRKQGRQEVDDGAHGILKTVPLAACWQPAFAD